jgi:hypothetical protein
MIVHHVPIAAGRKRIDTAIKTRCPRASHFIYYNIIDRTRGKRLWAKANASHAAPNQSANTKLKARRML